MYFYWRKLSTRWKVALRISNIINNFAHITTRKLFTCYLHCTCKTQAIISLSRDAFPYGILSCTKLIGLPKICTTWNVVSLDCYVNVDTRRDSGLVIDRNTKKLNKKCESSLKWHSTNNLLLMISNFLQSNKIVKVKAVFKDSNSQSY